MADYVRLTDAMGIHGQGFEALVAIETGLVSQGELPRKVASIRVFLKSRSRHLRCWPRFFWSSGYTRQKIMNTLTFPLSATPEMPRDKASVQDPYASEAQTIDPAR